MTIEEKFELAEKLILCRGKIDIENREEFYHPIYENIDLGLFNKEKLWAQALMLVMVANAANWDELRKFIDFTELPRYIDLRALCGLKGYIRALRLTYKVIPEEYLSKDTLSRAEIAAYIPGGLGLDDLVDIYGIQSELGDDYYKIGKRFNLPYSTIYRALNTQAARKARTIYRKNSGETECIKLKRKLRDLDRQITETQERINIARGNRFDPNQHGDELFRGMGYNEFFEKWDKYRELAYGSNKFISNIFRSMGFDKFAENYDDYKSISVIEEDNN